MPHLLLAGHFGCGNLGDDAIMLGFVQGLTRDYELTLLSGAPETTFRLYNIRSVPRKDFTAVKAAIEECDAMVFPGGSLFQDATSSRSVMYYAQLVKLAKKAGKKVYLVGQGVGPIKGGCAKGWTANAFNLADQIVCRDPQSASFLKSLGVKKPVQVSADCAFLLPEPNVRDDNQFGVGNMKAIGIAPRPYGKGKECLQFFAELARLLFQNQMVPVLVELDSKFDGPLIMEISKENGGKIPDIRKLETPMQMQSRLARLDSMISMRLHGGILAATVGVPAMMLSYDPKVTAFAKSLGFDSPLTTEGLTAQRAFESFIQFQKDRERYNKILERKREEMKEAAMLNCTVVMDAFRK